MMPYSLLIFDFDGTIADSLASALATFNRIAPGLGLRTITDIEAARATPTRELLKQMGVRFWQLPRIVRAFQAAVAEQAHELPLHPGMVEALRQLHRGGHRLGILSSNREDVIRACLRTHEAEDLFSFVVGYPKLFGKAKALRRILRREEIERERVLFIGDELRDLEAGRKVRIDTAAVTWGFHTEALLSEANPRFLIRHPSQLLAIPAGDTPPPEGMPVGV